MFVIFLILNRWWLCSSSMFDWSNKFLKFTIHVKPTYLYFSSIVWKCEILQNITEIILIRCSVGIIGDYICEIFCEIKDKNWFHFIECLS